MRIHLLAGAIRKINQYLSEVVYETKMLVGSQTFYGSQPTYGYRAPSVTYGTGVISNTRFRGFDVLIINWHMYDKTLGIVVKGDHRGLPVKAILLNGVQIPFGSISFNPADNTSTLGFNINGYVYPQQPGQAIVIQVLLTTPTAPMPMPVYEAELTVGVRTDVTVPNTSYGFRAAHLSTPMGAISNAALEGLSIIAFNWHTGLNELRIVLGGNARQVGKLYTVMLGGKTVSFKYELYDAVSNSSTLTFDTKGIDLPNTAGQKIPVVVFTAQGYDVPHFRHHTLMTVGSQTLTGLTFYGYRDPSNYGMGSISNPLYKGTNKIVFAQWNLTNKQFNLYIQGNVLADNITEIEVDGARLYVRLIHDYQAGPDYTRITFEANGWFQPLSIGETVDLRF